GLTDSGMYVENDETHIEGMVPLREIRSDFNEFDEARYRLVGRRTRRVFRLGDRVRIKVKSANLEQRLLDYELIEYEEDSTVPAPAPAVDRKRPRPDKKRKTR
ncbi:MAG: S1 RNA-binding domain-containing protein, partial [Bacteroidales bacterium]|nr:S1 RNA-binding domain-containing protein [Bacteroidales bacterium]